MKSPSSSELCVTGALDQFGEKWIVVRRGEKKGLIPVRRYIRDERDFFASLSDQGMIVTSLASKKQLKDALDGFDEWNETLTVASRPGFYRSCFVMPNGEVIGKQPEDLHVTGLRKWPLARSGDLAGWQEMARRFARSQSILTTALGVSFLGPVSEVLGTTANTGVLFHGPSSIGKTSALNVAASVWGAPLHHPGSIAMSLRTTDNALEQRMSELNGTVLLLDEANLLGSGAKQADQLKDIGFLLHQGQPKYRYDDSSQPAACFSFLVTSNRSMDELMAHHDDADAEAAKVRLISINAQANRKSGIFDLIPEGVDDSSAAIEEINHDLSENHGVAGKIFLEKLVAQADADLDGLKDTCEKYRKRFHDKAGGAIPGSEQRVLDVFASVHAAAALASDFEILPFPRKAIGKAVLACFNEYRSGRPSLSAEHEIDSYLRSHERQLYDFDALGPGPMRSSAIQPGFLKTVKGQRCLLIRPERWEAEFGSQSRSILKDLKASGALMTTEGLQLQTKIRISKPKERVYAIILDKL